jgi:hypothetical protein
MGAVEIRGATQGLKPDLFYFSRRGPEGPLFHGKGNGFSASGTMIGCLSCEGKWADVTTGLWKFAGGAQGLKPDLFYCSRRGPEGPLFH